MYNHEMALGQREYQDVLDQLAAIGLDGTFTQTGGMNAALEITLDGGIVLITDFEDTLSWNRDEHQGWAVGFYSRQDIDGLPTRFEATEDSSVEALIGLLQDVLLRGH